MANSALPIQKKGVEEEELQMKADPAQRKGVQEEELQMKAAPIQRKGIEEEEAVQGKFVLPIQKKANNTGLPDNLKSGIENLSGFAMDDVKVHYNSAKPAQLQAHAYAQGTDIHLGSGQEKHLPHEAWHVVQQKQGRVQPTMQMKGNINVNDDAGLENEADVMGEKAVQMYRPENTTQSNLISKKETQADKTYSSINEVLPIQRKVIARIRTISGGIGLPRVISELRIEGRAPTTVKNAQGDHTVAETLINESVRREVMNQQPKIALNNLAFLATLSLPDPGPIQKFLNKYWNNIDTMDGEDKNTVIEDMIQKYIELANKRDGTAFLRDEELTRGNKGERKAIGGVREIADKLEKGQEVNEGDLLSVAKNLNALIDIKYVEGHEEKYVIVVLRAIQHAVLSVLPQLTMEQIDSIVKNLCKILGSRDEFDGEDQLALYETVLDKIFN
ncbi:hypothetical protein B4N84_12085 [Flavobacterium sp. IR1]|nr:hypothetical protein B4N84_12085 [Flavobacterium sp. IR1]